MNFSSPAKQKLSAVLGTYAANELESLIAGMGGPVVHLENDELISGAKMFAVSIGVNGIRYEWPPLNQRGVLANDGDGHLSWREMAGAGSVSEVGLVAPPEFLVGEPVRTAGNLRLEKAPQPAGTVYAGPGGGKQERPTFRKLLVSDVPALPIAKVVDLQAVLDAKATGAATDNLREELMGALGRKVDSAVFVAAEAMTRRQIGDLERSKADRTTTTQIQSQVREQLARKVDVGAFEDQGRALLQRIEALVQLLEAKVACATPTFTGAAQVMDVVVSDGSNLSFGQNKGTRIGTSRQQRQAFYGAFPIPQPAGDILTGLANLGLISNPTLWQSDVVGLTERLDAIDARLDEFASK